MSRKKPTKQARRITLRDVQKMPTEEREKYLSQHRQQFAELSERWSQEQRLQERLRAELSGDGDDSLERALLSMAQLTGLDFDRLQDLPAREFYRIVRAAIRKQESENWIPVALDDLRHDKSTRSRYAKDPDSGLRSVGRGKFLVRRDRLSFFLWPIRIRKYLSEG